VTLRVVEETAGTESRLVAKEFVIRCLENEQHALAQANCERSPCDVIMNVAAQIIATWEAEAEIHGRVPLCVEKHLGANALRILLTGMCGSRLRLLPRQHSPCVPNCVVVMVSSCNSEHTEL